MKLYIVVLTHFCIWSFFSLVEWVAKYDGTKAKVLLLLIFSYFAFLTAKKVGYTKKNAIITTVATLFLFFSCERLVWYFLS
jgi:hypothetical protein